MNVEEICTEVCGITRECGSYILAELKNIHSESIDLKGFNNFVTFVDTESEKRLVSDLGKLLPQSGFLTEEGTIVHQEKEYTWIIDPLDGTTNFIHQIPVFSISIALQKNGTTILGVVYEINRDECFYAFGGGGAFLNGSKIKVSDSSRMQDSIIATGFPYADYQFLEPYMNVFRYVVQNTHGLRRMGSAAVDLSYTACGRFDAFFEYSLNPWDVAAGAYILQQAGGSVSDFGGGENWLHGREILATNGKVHKEFLEVIRESFR
ncbi:MAG: inositol monophosphatase [Bacteroidetes bacterium]|nr:inositol monophosphatase [Bacteroidota bacterium]MBU1719717.1 inositol monophosphatase [Bacteroidota bacterium]